MTQLLMNEPKNDLSKTNEGPAMAAPATKAEKVHSSRYEWEKNENDRPMSGSGVTENPLLSSLRNWLKNFL